MFTATLAVVLGLGVALAPGPSLALASANTLRGGLRSGVASSLAASLADLLIAVLAVTILFGVGDRLTSVIGVIGGVMLFGLGLDALVVASRQDPVPRSAATHRKFLQAALVEFGLPQALLFGLTVVGPVITHLRDSGDAWPWALVTLMITGLVLARLGVVIRVAQTDRPLERSGYRVICRLVGVSLIVMGLIMVVWFGQYALDI
ncbi:MAG TPA: LysE family transporter [Nocardioidaceae bacterium]|nr:LysE family transporter [Nocardioidaceae bacterium]